MLKWKNEYSVNVASIDEQHKKLIETGSRIAELLSLSGNTDNYDEIMLIIQELKDYVVYHFDFEEKLLQKHNYGSLDEQHFEHYFFTKKLDSISRKDIDSDQKDAILEIYNFVINWITDHILKSDMKYSSFLNEKGIF